MRGHINHQQEMLCRMLISGIEAEKIVEEENFASKETLESKENLLDLKDCFGQYRLDRELGRGGMGVVYKAYDIKLKRVVALKIILDQSHEKSQMARYGLNLLTLDRGDSIALWHIEKDKIVFKNKIKHEKIIYCWDINSTGKKIAFCDRYSLHVLDLPAWKLRSSNTKVHDAISCKFYPNNDKLVAIGNSFATVEFWNYRSSSPVKKYKDNSVFTASQEWLSIYCIDFSSDGTWLACGGGDQQLKLWNVEKSIAVKSKKEHKEAIISCAFDLKSKKIISGDKNGTLVLWKYSKKYLKKIREFIDPALLSKAHNDKIYTCKFRPNGKEIVTASNDSTLKLWHVNSGKLLTTFRGHYGAVKSFDFGVHGQKIFSVSFDRSIKVWDTRQRSPISIKVGGTGCRFSPDGTKIVTFGKEIYTRTIKLWDTKSRKQIKTLIGHRNGITNCCFHPDGKKIISSSLDMTIKIWDIETGETIRTLKGHRQQVNYCALNKDGTKLLSTSDDRTVKQWGLETGKLLKTFPKTNRSMSFCSFSSNSKSYIAASSYPGRVIIRNLENEALSKKIVSHEERIHYFAISPDKKNILTCGSDNLLRLWSFKNFNKPLQVYKGHKAWINKCIFTKDGNKIISIDTDGILKIWDVSY